MKSIAVAATAAVLLAAVSTSADARCRGCAVGAGVIGGLAAGAIIGSAIANSGPAYPAPPPAYYAPPPAYVVDEPVCRIERHRYWDGYGYRVRRVEVCD
ncbi:MAG TPA: hypothetical protein VGE73_00465 [Pseudolabrys sp.]